MVIHIGNSCLSGQCSTSTLQCVVDHCYNGRNDEGIETAIDCGGDTHLSLAFHNIAARSCHVRGSESWILIDWGYAPGVSQRI